MQSVDPAHLACHVVLLPVLSGERCKQASVSGCGAGGRGCLLVVVQAGELFSLHVLLVDDVEAVTTP